MRFINILLLTIWYVEGKGNERSLGESASYQEFNYAEPIKLYTDKNICIGYYIDTSCHLEIVYILQCESKRRCKTISTILRPCKISIWDFSNRYWYDISISLGNMPSTNITYILVLELGKLGKHASKEYMTYCKLYQNWYITSKN